MCEQICSANCFRYICMRPNGTCLYGCSIGYSGDTCENGEYKIMLVNIKINKKK